jgi:hypothetical protein
MASTYVNDLRLEIMATGDQSGQWGGTTNTNLELIGEAFSYGTEAITEDADTFTSTVADGASDPLRSMYVKYTGALNSTCTVTIAPNTLSKVWFIQNATTDSGASGPYSIIISQGSGAKVTIPNGETKCIATNGAGSGAIVYDVFSNLNLAGTTKVDDITVGDDLILNSDSSLISLGAGADATLTHDGTTGLTIAATPISIDATGELHLNSTTGDIKLQDDGVDQITFDLDGTAGEVIMKPAVDADDLVISQYDGTEVIRIEDNASLGLVGNKLNIANSSSDVVIKPLTDAKDIIFQQFDGTAVMTVEDDISLTINNDVSVVGRAFSPTLTTNLGSAIDLSLGNNFLITTTGDVVLTFTNQIAGQSGTMKFVNDSNRAVTAHTNVAISAADLATISATGTYMVSYFVTAAAAANTILVSASAILT